MDLGNRRRNQRGCRPLPSRIKELTYIAKDSRNNDFARGVAKINSWGGFDLSLDLPVNLNLGAVNLVLTTVGSPDHVAYTTFDHIFQVQEFRRPEFEVSAKVGEGPFFVLGSAVMTATAKYYTGGALPNADVTWEVRSRPGFYSPPGWDGFVFGVWRPWWRYLRYGREGNHSPIRRQNGCFGKTQPAFGFRSRQSAGAYFYPGRGHGHGR